MCGRKFMEVLKTTNEIMLQKLLHLRCIYLLGLFSPFSETQKPAFVWSGDFISRSPQQIENIRVKYFSVACHGISLKVSRINRLCYIITFIISRAQRVSVDENVHSSNKNSPYGLNLCIFRWSTTSFPTIWTSESWVAFEGKWSSILGSRHQTKELLLSGVWQREISAWTPLQL